MLSTFYKFNVSASGSGQVCPVDDIDGLEFIAAVTKQTKFYYYVRSSLVNILVPSFGCSSCKSRSLVNEANINPVNLANYVPLESITIDFLYHNHTLRL